MGTQPEMLATRIIPTMLGRNGALVKGRGYNAWRTVGSILQAARIYAARGVDELCYLDIGATAAGKGPDLELVRKLTDTMFCPITVGGGIRNGEDVRALLENGADKVVIGALARGNPLVIHYLTTRYGSQAITISADVPAGQNIRMVERWCEAMEGAGAGEILLNAMDRDGTMEGYRLDLIEAVSKAVSIPVIASCGCSGYEDMHSAIKAGASAVAAGALFQFTDATPREAAEYLSSVGVEVRL